MSLAKSVIPSDKMEQTPLVLKATAGLRLLSQESAESILENVRHVLSSNYSFRMNDNSVSILDGDSEGIYAWITINYLLEKIDNLSETVTVLDLGGGSTQITFSPSTTDLIPYSEDHLTQKNIDGKDLLLYTHSYLGFGLMSARKSILNLTGHDPISHPCFNHPAVWDFEGKRYNITPADGKCYSVVSDFVYALKNEEKIIRSPDEGQPSSSLRFIVLHTTGQSTRESFVLVSKEGLTSELEIS